MGVIHKYLLAMGYRQHNSIIMFKTPGLAKIQLKIYLKYHPQNLALHAKGRSFRANLFRAQGNICIDVHPVLLRHLWREWNASHPTSALPAASAPQCSRRGTLTPLPHRQNAPHLAGGVPPAALHAVAVVPRGPPEPGGHEGGVEVRPQGGGQGSGAAVARWSGGFAGCGREPTNMSSTCSGGLFHSSKKKSQSAAGLDPVGLVHENYQKPKIKLRNNLLAKFCR